MLAINLTPSLIAGIHGVPPSRYIPINAFSAAVLWAVPIGLGAYFAGPPIIDFVNDVGWVIIAGLVLLVLSTVSGGLLGRRLRRARRPPEHADSGN